MNLEMFKEVVRYRGLLGMLAWRDVHVRYKQSIMGFAWAFLMPLIQTVVLFAIFFYGNVSVGTNSERGSGLDYLLYVLTGTIPWTFFAGAIGFSIDCLNRNSRLVTKIYFPREVFPLGSIAAMLVDFGIGWAMFIPFYIYGVYNGVLHPSAALLLFPLVVLLEAVLVAGMALVLSMGNLFFRDVKYIMTFVMQLWFFATNVMYPIKFANHPGLQWVADANPMIPILNMYRAILLGPTSSNYQPVTLAGAGSAILLALIVFVGGWIVFHKAEFKFAEYI